MARATDDADPTVPPELGAGSGAAFAATIAGAPTAPPPPSVPAASAVVTQPLPSPIDPTGGLAPRPAGGAVGVPTPHLAALDPTGGLAPRGDRFDLILLSPAIIEPGRITYINGSITPVGNDGQHYGDSVNRQPNTSLPQWVADALHNASDHLPVFADFIFSAVNDVDDQSGMDHNIQVFPIPSSGDISIRFPVLRMDEISITIYDQTGRVVIQFENERMEPGRWQKVLSGTSFLNPGIYIIRITGNSGESGSAVFSR